MLHFETLIDVIENNKQNDVTGITFIDDDGGEKFVSYKQVYFKSLCLLKKFLDFGVNPGDELLFQIEKDEDYIYTIWACIMGKIIAVPVTVSKTEEHKNRILGIWRLLKNPFLITYSETLSEIERFIDTKSDLKELKDSINKRSILIDNIEFDNSYAEVNNDTKKEDIAFIMFSSGSTGIPKGVTLTHENVIVQI
ncbi:MAG: AMP-binding protein, partial [Bacillota bacterium]|nr:AMP-binding protein [Bacillota bacterium]